MPGASNGCCYIRREYLLKLADILEFPIWLPHLLCQTGNINVNPRALQLRTILPISSVNRCYDVALIGHKQRRPCWNSPHGHQSPELQMYLLPVTSRFRISREQRDMKVLGRSALASQCFRRKTIAMHPNSHSRHRQAAQFSIPGMGTSSFSTLNSPSLTDRQSIKPLPCHR
jgi:hypothetical protein